MDRPPVSIAQVSPSNRYLFPDAFSNEAPLSAIRDMKFVHQLSIASFLIVVLFAGSPLSAQSFTLEGTTMGVIHFRVKVASDEQSPEKLEAVKTAVNDSLQRVNQLMSTYIEDSDVSKFNRSTSTQWQQVDAETAKVVQRALEICKLTEGAFDPTVAPVVNAWNFGPGKKQQPKPPTPAQIEELAKSVGFENIDVKLDPPSLKKSIPSVQLDLSAIAKGYAVDRVGETLRSLGYENFMVVVGGEVYSAGNRTTGGPWNVAVEKPDTRPGSNRPDPGEEKKLQQVVKLSNRAIATSGDYRNYFEHDGQRYSHSIDPATCRPVEHGMAVASVVADDCMSADALATAVMVMGHKKGAELCQRLGYPLLTIHSGTDGNFVEHISQDFPLSQDHAALINKVSGFESEPEPQVEPAKEPAKEPVKESVPQEQSGESILPVFAATFVIFCLVVLGMAVGAIFNNKPVTGSCGGLANMTNEDGESVCGICSKPTTDCVEQTQTETQTEKAEV